MKLRAPLSMLPLGQMEPLVGNMALPRITAVFEHRGIPVTPGSLDDPAYQPLVTAIVNATIDDLLAGTTGDFSVDDPRVPRAN